MRVCLDVKDDSFGVAVASLWVFYPLDSPPIVLYFCSTRRTVDAVRERAGKELTLAEKIPSPSEIRLRDPLSEVTRKERRALLSVSAFGILIVKSGLIPSKVTALGIEFSQTDQRALIIAVAVVVTYFLLAFVVYAISDLVTWRVIFHDAVTDRVTNAAIMSKYPQKDEERSLEESAALNRLGLWRRFSRPVAVLRAIFEFGLPIIVGVYSAFLLFTASPPSNP